MLQEKEIKIDQSLPNQTDLKSALIDDVTDKTENVEMK